MRITHKLLIALLLTGQSAYGLQAQDAAIHAQKDTLPHPLHRAIHKLSVDVRPAYLAPTNVFFKGINASQKDMNTFLSGHLKYGIQFNPDSKFGRLYPHTTQGIGLAVNTMFNDMEIGTPVALYVFQSSRIASLTPRLSLDYEWGLLWIDTDAHLQFPFVGADEGELAIGIGYYDFARFCQMADGGRSHVHTRQCIVVAFKKAIIGTGTV